MARIWKYTDGTATVYGIYEGYHTNGLQKWSTIDEVRDYAASKGIILGDEPIIEVRVPTTVGVSEKQAAYASDMRRHQYLRLVYEQERANQRFARRGAIPKIVGEIARVDYLMGALRDMTDARTILDRIVYPALETLSIDAYAAAMEQGVSFEAALNGLVDDPANARRYRHAIAYIRRGE